MQLHLINGFLGAGKTTAIITAARHLLQQDKKVGIVTNDKGRFQVDAAFFQSNAIPTRQVAGGCFRCSFAEFEDEIAGLQDSDSPEVIFAESVGSCVDLVNTVFSPVLKNDALPVEKMTYSVFADIRLFQHRIQGKELPFSEAINYLYARQIEEGEVLILNKADMLTPAEQEKVFREARERFPTKTIFLQNSLDEGNVIAWLDTLERSQTAGQQPDFLVDYKRYKKGENDLCWLDQKFTLESPTPQPIKPALVELISTLLEGIRKEGIAIGHLKFFLTYPGPGVKLSFATADLSNEEVLSRWKEMLPEVDENSLTVVVNARAYGQAADFKALLDAAVKRAAQMPGVTMRSEEGATYNPNMSLNCPN